MSARTTSEIEAELRRIAGEGPHNLAAWCGLLEAADRLAELDALLERLSHWDQMVMGQGDEPYWLREIAKARGIR